MMWYRYIMWGALIVITLACVIVIVVTAVKESKKKDSNIALFIITRAITLLFVISLGAVMVTGFIKDFDEKISNSQVSVECSVCHKEVNTPYCGYCGTKVQ